ncbi:MAG: hypothetical protein WBB60_10565 [Nitrospira sp.]|jgi:hypothetical protein|nr:hypothetical protein [Nitrospira sp.]MBP6605505.1 hypothetical protein [Nitrospira sp.]HQY58962.1 hypothetical protein [Nitrospira sp.]HRA96872.1 hypothetical protein [Nitrospira sp.]HRC43953.1 hypothetical protein [Nitrospira sp.]
MTAGAIDPIEHWTTVRPIALVVKMVTGLLRRALRDAQRDRRRRQPSGQE